MVIITRDGTEYLVDDNRARAVRKSIANRAKMVDLYGDETAIISVSAIAQILSDEQFEATYSRKPKSFVPEIPPPLEVVELPDGGTRTPWKVAQFAELKRFFARNMAKPVAERGPHRAWIETEAEFDAVIAGRKPWPLLAKREKPARKVPAGYAVRDVSAKEYERMFAGKPGHWVLARYDGGATIAVTRARKNPEFTKVFPGATDPDLKASERWATTSEFQLIEARRAVHA